MDVTNLMNMKLKKVLELNAFEYLINPAAVWSRRGQKINYIIMQPANHTSNKSAKKVVIVNC